MGIKNLSSAIFLSLFMKKILLLQKFGLKRGGGGGVGGYMKIFAGGQVWSWIGGGGENIFKKGGLTRKRWRKNRGDGDAQINYE